MIEVADVAIWKKVQRYHATVGEVIVLIPLSMPNYQPKP